MITTDNLRKVRDLIADQQHWTTGAFSRMRDGTRCDPGFQGAVQWCLMGACGKVVGDDDDESERVADALRDALCDLGLPAGSSLIRWQDAATHQDVIGLLDRGIGILLRWESDQNSRGSHHHHLPAGQR